MRDTMVPLDGKELSPEAIRITSVSPPSSTMLMGRQSPVTKTATALVTFSRTGLVIFREKSWSVGWRPSNLGLLSVGCFALRQGFSTCFVPGTWEGLICPQFLTQTLYGETCVCVC